MPAKKMKKMAAKSECGCVCHKPTKMESMLLIILGAIGLLSAIGMMGIGQWMFYFNYVWPVLVIVIGMTMLMRQSCECC
ncbi:MAG: hypothetical protein NTV88_03555 [Candidatus Micrarchaeota archaeon]|nr:hypothetical protein [Candidatus Micrarchaeota archaeon]